MAGQCVRLQIYEMCGLIDKASDLESKEFDLEYHCCELLFSGTNTDQDSVSSPVLAFRISAIPQTCVRESYAKVHTMCDPDVI